LDFWYVKIQVANVEALKLGINSGELLVQEEGLLLLGQRFINGRGDLRADFS
jgi:hypothetical protein